MSQCIGAAILLAAFGLPSQNYNCRCTCSLTTGESSYRAQPEGIDEFDKARSKIGAYGLCAGQVLEGFEPTAARQSSYYGDGSSSYVGDHQQISDRGYESGPYDCRDSGLQGLHGGYSESHAGLGRGSRLLGQPTEQHGLPNAADSFDTQSKVQKSRCSPAAAVVQMLSRAPFVQ